MTKRTLSIWFFLGFCTIKSVQPLSSTFSWEELIQQATEELERTRYEQALDKLRIADESEYPRDARYYWIQGKALLGKGEDLEALKSFEASIRLQPEQNALLREMTDLYDSLRIADKALNTSRVLLARNPDDINLRYRAVIWASKIGNLEYYKQNLSDLEFNNPYKAEISALLDEIRGFQEKSQHKEVLDRCSRFLPYFPRNRQLHRICLSSKKAKDQTSYENGLLDRAAIFREDPIYHHELTMEYLDKRKFVQAGAMARRSYLLALEQSMFLDKDYLMPIRRIYVQNGASKDVHAIELLEEILLSKKSLSSEEWDSVLRQTGFNWEILVFAIHVLQDSETEGEANTLAKEWKEMYLELRGEELERDFSRFAGPYYLDKTFSYYLENR
ncbi:hypothetical protein CH373_04460 [Leptospira perolatii]|uniref:Uncharacterized protein n=1 Tax=Leptospira perolatii TaxID=2023191 RepID=A0A2M9ZQ72_9LEPT|nr:hypothetical protein [Leptospira perolatii]PJZ68250.1 hypothetical protein CH360_17185 [Leptospira perolatii]PJZ74175.1 hypothetical protein CH373_04460 [Leptospira perolatii]